MIAELKPVSRLALTFSAAGVVALCCFTFTRAAEKKSDLQKSEQEASRESAAAPRSAADSSFIQRLEKELASHDEMLKRGEAEADALRQKLGIPSDIAAGTRPPGLYPETIRSLEEQRIRVQTEYNGMAALLESLNQLKQDKGREELRKAILTVVNDEILSRLLQDLFSTEATLAKLHQSVGGEHTEFKSVAAMQADLDAKVNQRMDGILTGLKVKVDAFKAQLDSLKKSVVEARTSDAELAEKYRPYLEIQRKIENLQKVRDAVFLRILQEKIDAQIPKFKPESR